MKRHLFFLFFLLSGFCSLVYETVWTRLAMASFGVTTTVVSVVLSVFMLGLALGSWLAGAGWFLHRLDSGRRALRAYALAELGIGLGGLLIPLLFSAARSLLLGLGESSSLSYHLLSGVLLAAAMLPFTTLMGATFALALCAVRSAKSDLAFSYLYLANVLGATLGTLATPLFIEIMGFHHTLLTTALLNTVVCALAWSHSSAPDFDQSFQPAPAQPGPTEPAGPTEPVTAMLLCLLGTGFASMAMEVVWTRLFSPFIGTFVYGFAAVLAAYLFATYIGSHIYRSTLAKGQPISTGILWAALGLCSILPLAYGDRRSELLHGSLGWSVLCLALSVAPFCAALGLLTPYLVDRVSKGDPGRASRAYTANVIGCILGPLCSGFLLLPTVGERGTLALLALIPLSIGAWAALRAPQTEPTPSDAAKVRGGYLLCTAVTGLGLLLLRDPSEYITTAFKEVFIRRDATATVVAMNLSKDPAHADRVQKRILVNGVGMTYLTSITKTMAHLPLAHLTHEPKAALIICFGMGTTLRSFSSWGIDATAVELVPSVPLFFGYFHKDAEQVLGNGRTHVVIDDGRRFLDRTRRTFDVVALDPPPPVEAAGSSLLYSREFYQSVKRRLAPGGILQQWTPGGDPALISAMIQSLVAEFPYVRALSGIEGWGVHFLASESPIPVRSPAELAARLPAAARADLLEWLPKATPEEIFGVMLSRERPVASILQHMPSAGQLTDDHPVNEYFILRQLFNWGVAPPALQAAPQQQPALPTPSAPPGHAPAAPPAPAAQAPIAPQAPAAAPAQAPAAAPAQAPAAPQAPAAAPAPAAPPAPAVPPVPAR